MPRYFSGPLRHQEIAWWPENSLVLERPGRFDADLVDVYLSGWSPGGIILDPFARDPEVVWRAQRRGFSTISIHFDPLAHLGLAIALDPPAVSALDSTVTRLADSPKRGVPLRQHIQELYRTTCATCGSPAIADGYLWDRDQGAPVRKRYRCATCQQAFEDPVAEADLALAHSVPVEGLYRSYILDRFSGAGEEARELVQALLALYTPRSLYALVQLALKIDALYPDAASKQPLFWLLLQCLDLCTNLHPDPAGHAAYRPQRPRAPRQYLEINVWLAWEQAWAALRELKPASVRLAPNPADLLAAAPAGPLAPAAYVGLRSMRDLAQHLPARSVAAILAQPTQFDVVYWPLAYLWSGWLWGEQRAAPLWSLARRKAPSWSWYLQAVEVALHVLGRLLKADGQLVMAFEAADQAYPALLMLAAAKAGLRLVETGFAPGDAAHWTAPSASQRGGYRQTWALHELPQPAPMPREALEAALREEARRATVDTLTQRGEPVGATLLRYAIWRRLEERGLLRQAMAGQVEGGAWDAVSEQVKRALQEGVASEVVWLSEKEGGEEGAWWLQRPGSLSPPLDDRVEQAVRELLPQRPAWTWRELVRRIEADFPFPATPEPDLVRRCLEAYGDPVDEARWQAAATDAAWRMNLIEALARLGYRLGCGVWIRPAGPEAAGDLGPASFPPEAYVVWARSQEARLSFVLRETAQIDDLLSESSVGERYLVIPARRAGLLRAKLARSLLRQQRLAAAAWRIIKDDHLVNLAQGAQVSWHEWAEAVGLDPLIERDEARLPLFGTS